MKTIHIFIALMITGGALHADAPYDLLLKGGHVIDPKNNLNTTMDVAMNNGKIARVAPAIDPVEARRSIDVSGFYVTPGLVDIHVHVYAGTGMRGAYSGDNSVYPDGHCFRSGVTTVVDVGSSGWRNFENFKDRIIDRQRTRILAMLNIVGKGMGGGEIEQNTDDMDAKATAEMARKYPDTIVGIKTAHYRAPDWIAVDRAVEAGRMANIPVMVDFGSFTDERPFEELVTKRLRPGDMYTHMYLGRVPMLDANGKLRPLSSGGPQARRQVRRGPWRRQLPLEAGRSGDRSGLGSRLDLDRPPHRQHESRHERLDQRDVEDPQPGYLAL